MSDERPHRTKVLKDATALTEWAAKAQAWIRSMVSAPPSGEPMRRYRHLGDALCLYCQGRALLAEIETDT